MQNAKNIIIKNSLFCFAFFILIKPVYAKDNIIIIANKNVPIEKIDADTVKNIFIGNIIRWEEGGMISVALYTDDDAQKSFLRKYIKRSPQQFERTWRKNIFSGKGTYPKILSSKKRLLDYVSETDNAIGYIPSDMPLTKNVKIIAE